MTATPMPAPRRCPTAVAERGRKAPGAGKQAMGSRRFKTTRWTLVRRAIGTGEPPAEEARAALAELLESYRAPLLSWIMERREPDRARAEDLVHGLFLRVIERNLLARADRERGRLRVFLCRCLWNYASDQHKLVKREVSLGAEEGDGDAPESAGEAPDRSFDRAWAQLLVARAKAKVFEARYAGDPEKAALFTELVRWLESDADGETAAAVGARLGKSANAMYQAALTLKGHLRAQIRAEVAETLERREDLDDEMGLLLSALEDET